VLEVEPVEGAARDYRERGRGRRNTQPGEHPAEETA
jgi:hypothetical protein